MKQNNALLVRLLASIVAVMLFGVAPILAAEIHVALGGNDAGLGIANRAFGTLDRAWDEVVRIRSDPARHEAVTIVVHGGTYVRYSTLELGAQHSGTAEFPVVCRAADGEEVRICGGPVLPADGFSAVTDVRVLARLNKDARPHVLQFDLKPLRLMLVDSPAKYLGAPSMPELFFNDRPMTVARWPNADWATIAKVVDSGQRPGDGDHASKAGVFAYSGDEPARWNLAAGVWLHGYWCFDWHDETIRVASIDRAKKLITLAEPAAYGVRQGNPSPRRFFATNLLEELDSPGEYYIQRGEEILYFWPPAAMEGARISLSTLDAPLLRLKDAEHVTVRGMIFESGLGNGIEIEGGREDAIESCVVRNVRQLGINVNGGEKHRVDRCDITETGTGGVHLSGGDRKTLTPGGHVAINNHIWNFSRNQLTGAYAIVLDGVGNTAGHNHIHDGPHQAVLIGGNDHVVEFNEIDHVVTASDDAGAVYKGRNPSCRGNVIRYNYFHDIGSAMGAGTSAIYFDDGDGGDLVFGNVFVRAGNPGGGAFGTIFSHGGHGIRAENNIFVDCVRALGSVPWDDARWKDAINGGQDCFWTDKLLKQVDITKPPFTTRYPELVGFMEPKVGVPRVSEARNNVLVRCANVSNGNWQVPGDSVWRTDVDPGFVDAAKGNYGLCADSEVFKRLPGFKAIPFEQIGMTRK